MPALFTLPTARMTTRTRGPAYPSADFAGHRETLGIEPEALDVVKPRASSWKTCTTTSPKSMSTHAAAGIPSTESACFRFLAHASSIGLRQRVDVAVRAPGHEHEEVGVVDLANNVEDLDGDRLLLEGGGGDDQRKLATRRRPGGCAARAALRARIPFRDGCATAGLWGFSVRSFARS